MKSITLTLMIVFIVALIIIGPIVTIWALNTLFPSLAIPYDFFTWLAVIVLGSALRANVNVKGEK
jgi:hypothetical protein